MENTNSYVLENSKKFQAALKDAGEKIGNLRVPLNLIMNDFYRSEKAIFQLKGAGQYPEISKRYGLQKEGAVGFKYPLLVRTGRLAKSMLSKTAPGAVALISEQSLTIGTTVRYGIYHQSDEPRKKIPLRKFVFIGPEAPKFATSDQMGRTERWLGYINDYVTKKLELKGQ